jgi:hypothetical protein
MNVRLNSKRLARGSVQGFSVELDAPVDAPNLQYEIARVGVKNPWIQLGAGIQAGGPGTSFSASFDTDSLEPGFYEIVQIIFHGSADGRSTTSFSSGVHFPRTVFKVEANGSSETSDQDPLAEVHALESAIDQEFVAGVHVSPGSAPIAKRTVFVFIEGVHITGKTRLDGYEVLPIDRMDGADLLQAINKFFARTPVRLEFFYDSNLAQAHRGAKPACVVHFPAIDGPSVEEISRVAIERSATVLNALSLIRNSAGELRALVLIDESTGQAELRIIQQPYVGNLAGGMLAGEDPNTIAGTVVALSGDPQLAFFVDLIREARSERRPDFQALRYWVLLETIAEARRFPRGPLTDVDGNPILDAKGKPEQVKEKDARVFTLLKEMHGHGGINPTASFAYGENQIALGLWRRTQIWYDFRNAVAHYGSWQQAIAASPQQFSHLLEIVSMKGHGPQLLGDLLRDLRDTCTIFIRREIARHRQAGT